jgi:tetratricopeptide (TPR) repeat protein
MNRNRIVLLGVISVLALAAGLSAFAKDSTEEAAKLFQEAQDLAKTQKFEQAATLLQKVIKLVPDNDRYLAMASEYEFKSGQYADGVEHALQAIKLNDKVGDYYVLVAANAQGDQDLDRAREYCELVLKRGPQEFGPGPCTQARFLLGTLSPKTYTLLWNLNPQKGKLTNGQLAIALPKGDLPYQTITYEISGVQSHKVVKGEANDILYVVPQGTKPFPLTRKVSVQPYSFKKELAKATNKPLPEEVKVYLGPGESINPKSPALLKVVAGLKGENSVETARNIVAWMKKNVEYKLDKKPISELDFKSVDEIVERGHAECHGYGMLFTALCRAAGIPARPIWGLIRIPPGQDSQFGDIASHSWSEIYVAGCGWVPVDPQRPETLGCLPTSCIRVFMDGKKNKASAGDILPMINLIYMNGDKLKFEESYP